MDQGGLQMSTISKSIRRLRILSGLTQDQLAEQMHVTRQTISKWETEKALPDVATLSALASVFGTDLYDIIYGQPYGSSKEKRYSYLAIGAISLAGCIISDLGRNYLSMVLPRTYFRWYCITEMLLPAIFYIVIAFLAGTAAVSFILSWISPIRTRLRHTGAVAVASLVPPLVLLLEISIALTRYSFSGLLLYSMMEKYPWSSYLILLVLPSLSAVFFFLSTVDKTAEERS